MNQTLQLLFNNEHLGLIAYTQFVIPVMYMVYMAALQTLPNRVFYPEARNVHDVTLFVDRVLVIGLSAAFQFVSLLALHTIVASRFSVSTLYQIAFVLETHAALIQEKVASCFIFAVGFPLEHYGKRCTADGSEKHQANSLAGSDFSFRFSWMQRENSGDDWILSEVKFMHTIACHRVDILGINSQRMQCCGKVNHVAVPLKSLQASVRHKG
ncbi:hypothetical protein PRNP1_014500 [Phytophthora ramorum]